MHPVAAVIPLLIVISWARIYRPINGRIEGTILQLRPLPLLARIRMHAVTSTALIVLTTALIGTGRMHWSLAALPIMSIALLMTIPVRYVITDRGIRLGWTEFRRWTEFAGVRRARFGARLIGSAGRRPMYIWLSASRGDDEFLHFLRQTLKRAWRGHHGQASPERGAIAAASLTDAIAPLAACTTGDTPPIDPSPARSQLTGMK